MAANESSDAGNRRQVQHASFTIERVYDASPAQVFAAFASADAKARWFAGTPGQWREQVRELDFRVGGHERLVGLWSSGTVSAFDARYHDIVQDQRIVYSYGMHIDDRRISVSLATLEFSSEGNGTRLILTEQGAFLDGYDDAGSRERGTNDLLDALGAALRQARTSHQQRKEQSMKLNTYLTFNDQCAAAFKFYAHVLGGKIAMMQTHGDSPIAAQTPPERHASILHARLEVDGDVVLMGSDAPPQFRTKPEGFSVSIQVDTIADAERIFGALAEGGTVKMPIQETFWAARFGMCIDRFETPWMVNCDRKS